jgi:small ligand-binding sensory domain FIST
MRAETLTCRVGAGLSSADGAVFAAAEAAREARAALAGAPVDLAFVFLSAEHLDEAEAALWTASTELGAAHLLGCVAQGVVGRDQELEDGPGVSIWAGAFPGSAIETFYATAFESADGIGVGGIPDLDGADLVTLLVDPFTFPAAGVLAELEGVPVVGGLAASTGEPEAQALFLDGEVLREGAVGVVLRGVRVKTVVSQGCAPVGTDSVITNAEENVVLELAASLRSNASARS